MSRIISLCLLGMMLAVTGCIVVNIEKGPKETKHDHDTSTNGHHHVSQ